MLVTAGALFAFSLGGCDGQEIAERPPDEPVRTADDIVPLDEETARQVEEQLQEDLKKQQ
jgi:hypothetical protein